MAIDVIDHRLIGALHVRALDRAGLAHDRATEHAVWQAGTLDALMGGRYDGDITVGELLAHGDHGIGTLQHLDGEMVVLDGEPWVIDHAGRVRRVPPETRTPFAVLCPFAPSATTRIAGPLGLRELHAALDALAAGVRGAGRGRAGRRGVHRPHPAQRRGSDARRTRRSPR